MNSGAPSRVVPIVVLLFATFCAFAQQTTPRSLNPPRYVLRAGDTLELQYRLTPEFNQTVVVQPDGYISLNVAGELHVAGLTIPATHDLIVEKESDRLNKPELNLILEEFTHPSFVIAGQVLRPGQFELKERTTALGAVILAGGFSEDAQTGQVLLFRKVDDEMDEVTVLNLSKMRHATQTHRDPVLQPGDKLYVPRDKISKIEQYIRIVNTGVFFNPLQNVQ